ncbi:MAG: hypothetical protein P8Y92_09935 [Halioglobus sp.]
MKNWFAIVLAMSLLAFFPPGAAANESATGGDQQLESGGGPNEPLDPNDPSVTWVDSSHAYATDQAQALTEWMDSFFGDPVNDLEQAESWLRLDFISDWDEDDGSDLKVRLRGKVQLPRISKRLDLVFSGDDGDDLGELQDDEREVDDQVGLQYEILENLRSRVDATLGFSSGHLRPGLRYRFRNPIGDHSSLRFTERIQHENDEGFYSTTQLDLYRTLDQDRSLRWSNRLLWGEETDGLEWRTRLSLRERLYADSESPLAVAWFGSVNGVTDPHSYVKNFRFGALVRGRIYRKFLYLEVEPAYNFRKRDPDENREGAWSVVFRLEVHLRRDLRSVKSENDTPTKTGEEGSAWDRKGDLL